MENLQKTKSFGPTLKWNKIIMDLLKDLNMFIVNVWPNI